MKDSHFFVQTFVFHEQLPVQSLLIFLG